MEASKRRGSLDSLRNAHAVSLLIKNLFNSKKNFNQTTNLQLDKRRKKLEKWVR